MRFVMIYFWILLIKKTIESSLKEMFTKVGDNNEIRLRWFGTLVNFYVNKSIL